MSQLVDPVAPAHRPPLHLPAEQVWLLALLACGLVVVSPLGCLALSTLLLINLPVGTPRPVRLALAVTAVLAMSMIMGARPIDPDVPNDIDAYYDIYQSLVEGYFDAVWTFGGGLEVGLPMLTYAFVYLLPSLTPNGLMFCFALAASLLLVAWVERAFYAERGRADPALMGACILLLNLYFATQLSRQFFALVILLYAISARGSRRWLWLAVATSFHLTALPFFGLYVLARRGWRGWVGIIAVTVLFRVFFWQLVAALDIVPQGIADKLAYYVDNFAEYTEADLASMRMIFLLSVLSLVSLAASRFRPARASRPWLAAPWIAAAVHILLLPIPLASLRTTLMIHSVVPGLIAYAMLSDRGARALMPAALHVLWAYKIGTFATAEDFANLRPMLTMLTSFLQ